MYNNKMKALASFSPIPSPVLGKLKHFKSQTDLSMKSNPPPNPNHVDLHMHQAVISGNIGMIRFALDNGQSIHSSINGLQAIHVAAGFGQLAIMKYLVSRGANVNSRRGSTMPDGTEINNDKIKGPTPLHFAASNGHIQVVEYLLERGADPDIEDQYGCTPIDIALAQGYIDIYKLLSDYSIGSDSIPVPQMPASMTNNIKMSPNIIPGSPSSQSVTTPKLQYQNKISSPNLQKISSPNLQFPRKNSVPAITVNRSPVALSPPDHSASYPKSPKSPKAHNIKNGGRSPITPPSQPISSKSPLLNSRFNVVLNSQDFAQSRLRRGVSERNIKQIDNDDLIYDTQKISKNYVGNANTPLFIKDGNLISSSYQPSSSSNYMNSNSNGNNNDIYPNVNDGVKNSGSVRNTTSNKNAYEGTPSSNYYNDEPYALSDSDEDYMKEELNDPALERYSDSFSDSDALSPSSSMFNASPPKSMTELYQQSTNYYKSQKESHSRSNSPSSNRRKNSTGSLRNEVESDREQSSQKPKNYYRSRSNSRTDVNCIPANYFRSRSNSRPDITMDPSGYHRSRSNSKPDILNYSGSYRTRSRSRSNSNSNPPATTTNNINTSSSSKLESSSGNGSGNGNGSSSSNYYSKSSGLKERAVGVGNSSTNNGSSSHSHTHRSRSRSNSNSKSEQDHYSNLKSRSKSRSDSRSVSHSHSRSRSNSQSLVNPKLNGKPSTTNVNPINTLFNFTNMKNSLNSPDSQPSSYSSEFSIGSGSDKEIFYSNSVNSNNGFSLKQTLPESQSQSHHHSKGKSKYSNHSGSSHHVHSPPSQSQSPSQIPIPSKPTKPLKKPSIDSSSQQSYSSLKGYSPSFPEGVIRNRSYSSNSQANNYPSKIKSRSRSYSNNSIGPSKSTSPFNKPAQASVSPSINPPESSSYKSRLSDVMECSLPRSTSS